MAHLQFSNIEYSAYIIFSIIEKVNRVHRKVTKNLCNSLSRIEINIAEVSFIQRANLTGTLFGSLYIKKIKNKIFWSVV